MERKIYFNKMQREVLGLGAKDAVIVAGRGTGKGLLHAGTVLRNVQAMPRSTGGYVAPNAIRALTNTIPSMTMHLESWGFKRDLHWCIGHKPPKKLGWPDPLIVPDRWENFMSFYTGAVIQIISQDRKGTSNSKSFDYLNIDEAKFIKFEQLKDETFQANRGQLREFGSCPWHHGMTVTSDMPVTKSGSWFLNYKSKCDKESVDTLAGLVAEQAYLTNRLNNEKGAPVDWLLKRLKTVQDLLSAVRKETLLYKEYSSLTNLEVLGESYIRQMHRDLPALVFQASVLCLPVRALKDGFYSSMRQSHVYSAADTAYLDSLGYDFDKLRNADWHKDADVLTQQPLCIAFDYNRNINWLVVGQNDEDNARMNTVRSFWVKYDRKLPELIADFSDYYRTFPTREVVYYYDTTALGSNYAVNSEDFRWVVCHELEKHGWKVTPVYIGNPMGHADKHLLINRGFAGQTRLTPYFNEEANADLLVSIQTAGVYNGKKDKRGEKLAETEEDRLEARTDGSDAWDTLYIGCELFPQIGAPLPVSSNWS